MGADLCAMDLVPEPIIVAAALRACRRVNDFSLTTRILEVVRIKCGSREAQIWPCQTPTTFIELVGWTEHQRFTLLLIICGNIASKLFKMLIKKRFIDDGG